MMIKKIVNNRQCKKKSSCGLTVSALLYSGWCSVQKWATAYSINAPKMKLKQIPKYTSIALMKQLALGRDVLAPIIRVVIVNTVVTPLKVKHKCKKTTTTKKTMTGKEVTKQLWLFDKEVVHQPNKGIRAARFKVWGGAVFLKSLNSFFCKILKVIRVQSETIPAMRKEALTNRFFTEMVVEFCY